MFNTDIFLEGGKYIFLKVCDKAQPEELCCGPCTMMSWIHTRTLISAGLPIDANAKLSIVGFLLLRERGEFKQSRIKWVVADFYSAVECLIWSNGEKGRQQMEGQRSDCTLKCLCSVFLKYHMISVEFIFAFSLLNILIRLDSLVTYYLILLHACKIKILFTL